MFGNKGHSFLQRIVQVFVGQINAEDFDQLSSAFLFGWGNLAASTPLRHWGSNSALKTVALKGQETSFAVVDIVCDWISSVWSPQDTRAGPKTLISFFNVLTWTQWEGLQGMLWYAGPELLLALTNASCPSTGIPARTPPGCWRLPWCWQGGQESHLILS